MTNTSCMKTLTASACAAFELAVPTVALSHGHGHASV